MIPGLVLALLLSDGPTSCANANTQADMNACAAQDARRADSNLNASYRQLMMTMREHNMSMSPLTVAENDWIIMRDQTCAYISAQYEGGSMQPMQSSSCIAKLTRERTHRLDALRSAIERNALTPRQAVDPEVDRRLNDVYKKVRSLSDAPVRRKLESAELAWITYRDHACAVEGGTCVTDLERERALDLSDTAPDGQ